LPSDSPAWTAEAYFWIFDATPMVVFALLLNVMHPSKFFNINNTTRGGADRSPQPDASLVGAEGGGGGYDADGDVETGVERKEIELRTVYSNQSL
jgi:hypothetical protein